MIWLLLAAGLTLGVMIERQRIYANLLGVWVELQPSTYENTVITRPMFHYAELPTFDEVYGKEPRP